MYSAAQCSEGRLSPYGRSTLQKVNLGGQQLSMQWPERGWFGEAGFRDSSETTALETYMVLRTVTTQRLPIGGQRT